MGAFLWSVLVLLCLGIELRVKGLGFKVLGVSGDHGFRAWLLGTLNPKP